ncbi:MAG: hypothetical protein GY696_35090, partial [Gammaproteobacteria bacterium]|nr:hypothetical protein [Gammaproteobacteria bacterium]
VQYALRGLEGVEVYTNDILIHGPTQEVHDARLCAVFQRLEKFGFRLLTTKTLLGKETIPAFSYIISKDGVPPGPDNVKPILEAASPTSTKEVQQFLGAINYFQDFLEDVSSIAEPLRALTRKETTFSWGPTECKVGVGMFTNIEDRWRARWDYKSW